MKLEKQKVEFWYQDAKALTMGIELYLQQQLLPGMKLLPWEVLAIGHLQKAYRKLFVRWHSEAMKPVRKPISITLKPEELIAIYKCLPAALFPDQSVALGKIHQKVLNYDQIIHL